MQKAQAALEKARVELDAKKQLFHDNVASLFELKEGEANVATAKADLALAKRNLEGTSVLAPYDGKVIAVSIEEFETPQLGKPLMETVDDEVLIARFLVPSYLLPRLSLGLPFNVVIRETGEKIPVKISRIGSVIDPSSGTVKIEADIDNRHNKLRAGMTGQAVFNFNGK
jgi:RND family efflux transporter MFP subunit